MGINIDLTGCDNIFGQVKVFGLMGIKIDLTGCDNIS